MEPLPLSLSLPLPLPLREATRALHRQAESSALMAALLQGQQALRQQLTDWLAAAPLSAAASDRVVDEARWSFEQHRRLFDELAG